MTNPGRKHLPEFKLNLPLIFTSRAQTSIVFDPGGDMASTWVTKPEVHAEGVTDLFNPCCKLIVANDDNYALAA